MLLDLVAINMTQDRFCQNQVEAPVEGVASYNADLETPLVV